MSTSNKILDDLVMSLGQTIRKRRLELKFSQEKLAEDADFDRTYVSLIERGKRNPSFTNFCRIAEALRISPSKLLENLSYDKEALSLSVSTSTRTPSNQKRSERRSHV